MMMKRATMKMVVKGLVLGKGHCHGITACKIPPCPWFRVMTED
jgi:hypothetical protein